METTEYKNRQYHPMKVLFEKEVCDIIRGKRMLLLALLILLMTLSGLYAALTGIADSIANEDSSSTFLFLKLYTVSANSIPGYTSLMALLGPFIGIFMGFDAINNERSEGTLNRLVSQPVYRDNVIVSKFLASIFVIGLLVLTSVLMVAAAGILATGLVPDMEDAARVLVYLIFSVIYISFWLAAAMLFSAMCRHAATSALASIAVWLISAIFISLLAGIIADLRYPLSTDAQYYANALNNYNTELGINRISPYYLFGEATAVILNPGVRTINAVTMTQLTGAVSSTLSLGQSLLLVWPHLTAMAAFLLILFILAYLSFMRQEIRSH